MTSSPCIHFQSTWLGRPVTRGERRGGGEGERGGRKEGNLMRMGASNKTVRTYGAASLASLSSTCSCKERYILMRVLVLLRCCARRTCRLLLCLVVLFSLILLVPIDGHNRRWVKRFIEVSRIALHGIDYCYYEYVILIHDCNTSM